MGGDIKITAYIRTTYHEKSFMYDLPIWLFNYLFPNTRVENVSR